MRLRILLPLCNAAIDVALLVGTVYAVDAFRSTLRHPRPLWNQRYEGVDPNFLRYADGPPMPAPLQAIFVGTMPATIASAPIADAVFANGWLSWQVSTPFDFRLACLHLCLAAVFWYAVGRGLESRRPRWSPLAVSYVAVRLLTIPASLILRSEWWMLCCALLTLAWIVLAVAVALKGLWHIWLRSRSARAGAR
jgi:hypothetical protein